MDRGVTRRNILGAVGAGSAVAIAGCSSGTTDGPVEQEPEPNNAEELPEPTDALVIESDEQHTLQKGVEESYDGIIIHSSGALVSETTAELELRELTHNGEE